MSFRTVAYEFYKVLEDKTEQRVAVITLNAAEVKPVLVSQYIDLRQPGGETFATLTFPSWVKVRKLGG